VGWASVPLASKRLVMRVFVDGMVNLGVNFCKKRVDGVLSFEKGEDELYSCRPHLTGDVGFGSPFEDEEIPV